MNENSKITFRTQLPVFLAQIVLCGLMVAVYAIIGRLDRTVVFGALLGMAASLANYGMMIVSLLRAEKSDDPKKGQLKAQGFFILRMLILLGILIVALKFGPFNPLATLLPLILMRLAIYLGSLVIKRGGNHE